MLPLLERGLDAINWLDVVMVLLVGLAGWAAWKKMLAHSSEEIYQRVAQAYKVEAEMVQEHMRLLEQENQHLKQVLETSKHSLARRGLYVTENGEVGEESYG